MERHTYEITLHGWMDSQMKLATPARELARECFRLFDEPDSAEMYSEIELSATTGKQARMRFWKR